MITELKPTNLIAVEVAPDANGYTFGHLVFGELIYPKDLFYNTKMNVWNVGNEILPEGNYKILGEATKDKIGFDVEPYVENNGLGCYDNYKGVPDNRYTCLSKEESLYSLLEANGLYFVNPIDYKPSLISEGTGTMTTQDWQRNTWERFEADLVKGKLLILEKAVSKK